MMAMTEMMAKRFNKVHPHGAILFELWSIRNHSMISANRFLFAIRQLLPVRRDQRNQKSEGWGEPMSAINLQVGAGGVNTNLC